MTESGVHPTRRRAFTLMEALVVVIVIALVVPIGMQMLTESEEARRQSAATAKAVTFAQAMLEQVTADMHSGEANLGFDALDDIANYMDNAGGKFTQRTQWITVPYAAEGMACTWVFSAKVDSNGVTTGDLNEDVYRLVTAHIQYTGQDGAAMDLPVTTVVTSLD